MNKELINDLLFLGMGLYGLSAIMFLFLFLRTLRTKDGIGLFFLRILTLGLFIGSFTVAIVRFGGLYIRGWDDDLGKIIATVNPLTLLGVGLYLNFLFHHPEKKLPIIASKDIKEIKENVIESGKDIKIIKKKVVKKL